MRKRTDTFALNPITLGAIIAGLIAFVLTGGIAVLIWVAIASAFGAAIGWIVHRFALQADEDAAGVEGRDDVVTRMRS